jgi:hypothetical protein
LIDAINTPQVVFDGAIHDVNVELWGEPIADIISCVTIRFSLFAQPGGLMELALAQHMAFLATALAYISWLYEMQ